MELVAKPKYVTCTRVGYVEGKQSSTEGDICDSMTSPWPTWTLRYVVNGSGDKENKPDWYFRSFSVLNFRRLNKANEMSVRPGISYDAAGATLSDKPEWTFNKTMVKWPKKTQGSIWVCTPPIAQMKHPACDPMLISPSGPILYESKGPIQRGRPENRHRACLMGKTRVVHQLTGASLRTMSHYR